VCGWRSACSAPQPDRQAVERSAVRRQGARYPAFTSRHPNRAFVLSIDEKSQIQALDREQPVLPMMPGVPERRTHSYVRHGTTSLFAALYVASGFVIGKCYERHRAAELLDFLKEIDAHVPEGLEVHTVMDNYAAHKTPNSRRGSPAGHTIISTSRRLRRHGSNRSSAGSLSSPESDSGAAFIPQSDSSKPISHLHRPTQRKPPSPSMDKISRPNPSFSQTPLPENTADSMR
jgi:hypothetical protein